MFTGVTGEALYQNQELTDMKLEVALTFNGKTETVGFARHLSNLIGKNTPESWNVEMLINSSYGPEALVVKKKGSKETYLHIYE